MTSSFTNQIYNQLKKVPEGKVTTYKALAESLGSKAYRAVGTVMKNNPFAPDVPCHRVINSNGFIGGFKGQKTGKSIKEKIALLQKEGVIVKNGKIINFEKIFFSF